jgi:hypothetical protein
MDVIGRTAPVMDVIGASDKHGQSHHATIFGLGER